MSEKYNEEAEDLMFELFDEDDFTKVISFVDIYGCDFVDRDGRNLLMNFIIEGKIKFAIELIKKYEENDDLKTISRFCNGIILLLRSENRIIGDVLSDVKETIVFPYLNAVTHTELFKMIYEYRILCILSSISLWINLESNTIEIPTTQHIINNHE